MAQLSRWFNATIIHAQVKICHESMEEREVAKYEMMLLRADQQTLHANELALEGAVQQALQLCCIHTSFQWIACGRILSTQIVRVHVAVELG